MTSSTLPGMVFDVGRGPLNTLHSAGVDRMLTPDGLLKTIAAEAPATFIRPEDLATPVAVRGIVRAKRFLDHGADGSLHRNIQEYRELCACELFDCVAEAGAVELTRGCVPPRRPSRTQSQ